MISFSPGLPITGLFDGAAAPAAGIVVVPSFWTPVVYLAVAVEIGWLAAGLAFLWWLTRRNVDDREDPRTPKKLSAREDPKLAA